MSACRIRRDIRRVGHFWREVPEDMHHHPLDDETRECFEKIRQEWEIFRDAMTMVFGE
jgi:hypothetical protein